jgi:hypothetical protein
MSDFACQRIAFLRGYAHDDPYWASLYKDVEESIDRILGGTNLLDLFVLSLLDESDAECMDKRLNKAWFEAIHRQAESYLDHDYDDYYDCRYDDHYAYEGSAQDVWDEEDLIDCQEGPPANVDQEYRYFIRYYGNVWRAGHERRRLRQTG